MTQFQLFFDVLESTGGNAECTEPHLLHYYNCIIVMILQYYFEIIWGKDFVVAYFVAAPGHL